ncbi:Protein yippee-like 2 [Acipenser ruthenus]|uniref:Protein yippee-like 2 n=1 Tax=Acipenser ruthenus TaxID=7906 RepID=A0A444V2E8_ACIRT|nr:Protein yippee-like 2 [Acipenser ruthenus]
MQECHSSPEVNEVLCVFQVCATPPSPTTALTCVLRCFPCEPTWAGSPFPHRHPAPPVLRMTRSKTFQAYLPSCHRTYSCIHCRAHLANHDELISKVPGRLCD